MSKAELAPAAQAEEMNMAEKASISSAQAESAANLMFALFIYLSDAENGMSAREVQCLQEMIENPDWCDAPLLKAGLVDLGNRYGALWKEYQSKILRRDLSQISSRLNDLLEGIDDSARVLSALRLFCKRLCLKSSPALVRLGLVAMPEAKQALFRNVENALSSLPQRDLHRPVPSAPPEPAPEPSITTGETRRAVRSLWPYASLNLSVENVWKPGRTSVQCVAVIPETQDVSSFVFQAVQPVLFSYKPGQFVTLELQINGRKVRRSYTISSSPSRPHSISITVKRVPGGLVSNWLHDNMRLGLVLSLSGPHGEFTCFDAPAEKLLLISAGSGITPVMSMLRWLVDTVSNADIVFINNIRSPGDIIFNHELKYLGMRLGERLKIGIIPSRINTGQAWNGPNCRFSEQVVRMWAPDFVEREVFVCGPGAYMDAVRSTLSRMGLPDERYHQESFGTPTKVGQSATRAAAPVSVRETAPALPASDAPTKSVEQAQEVELVFSVSGKTVKATSIEPILEIAEANGVAMQSSCRSGTCGTCKIRKIEGKVEMDEQQALSEADINDGLILACVGRVSSGRVLIEA